MCVEVVHDRTTEEFTGRDLGTQRDLQREDTQGPKGYDGMGKRHSTRVSPSLSTALLTTRHDQRRSTPVLVRKPVSVR